MNNMDTQDYKFFTRADMDRTRQAGNFMIPIFDEILSQTKIQNVLDVGCGNGFIASYLKESSGCYLAGIDGSSYGLEEARRRGFDDVHLVSDFCSDAFPEELVTRRFDLVICKDVLEHLYDPIPLLNYVKRILPPTGRFLVLVPNHFPFFYRLKFLLTNKLDTQNYFPEATEWNFPHVRFFTDKGMRQLFEQVGLCVDKTYCNQFAYFPLLRRLPGGRRLRSRLADRYPSEFATALCYQLKLK